MLLPKLVQLWPYILAHFLFSIAVALVGYAALAKWLKPRNIQWYAALILGVLLSIYHSGTLVLGVVDFSKTPASAPAATAAPSDKEKAQLELKGQFFQEMDRLTSAPDTITAEAKTQLFSKFASIIQNADDKKVFADNITHVYDCQRYFLMDLQVSQKIKSAIKSQQRIDCENSDGRFFNREKLLAPEVITGNQKLIDTVTKKNMTPEEEKLLSADAIAKALELQEKRLVGVKKIFE
jgi:hypothetical protein